MLFKLKVIMTINNLQFYFKAKLFKDKNFNFLRANRGLSRSGDLAMLELNIRCIKSILISILIQGTRTLY